MGATGTRDSQIVQIQRVFRAKVATDATLTAGHAAPLGHSKFVQVLKAGWAKIDRDIRKGKLLRPAEGSSSGFHNAGFGREVGLRYRINIEHVRHEIVVRIERATVVAAGPAVLKNRRG